MRSLRLVLLAGLLLAGIATAAPPAQRTFPTPQAAAQALHDAVRAGDAASVAAVLGPGSADIVDSGDVGEDQVARERFLAAFEHSMHIRETATGRAVLVIGADDFDVPFPLVKAGAAWRFDTVAGRAEVLARRIGRNELAVMQALLAVVDAQREYSVRAHDGIGPGVYAARIASQPGRHDGLYWTPTREDPLSPLGVRFMLAAVDEAAPGDARPYHGYFFRLLPGQGASAAGGAREYLANGRMIAGFALVAWPARYRVSGVNTFIVSHEGVVYSRDLGPRTASVAAQMRSFDPAPGWRRESAPPARSGAHDRLRVLAGERGCTLCHRGVPAPREADSALPLAPSWTEIAARYRAQPDAEEKLTRTVIEGADPADRHWKDRQDFVRMGGNAPHVTPDEARALVRWILSTP